MPYNFAADSFHTKKLCDLYLNCFRSSKMTILKLFEPSSKIVQCCVRPLWRIHVEDKMRTYTVHYDYDNDYQGTRKG